MSKMKPMDHIDDVNNLYKGLDTVEKFTKDTKNTTLLEI